MPPLLSPVLLVHGLTADAHRVGDRDPGECATAGATHLLGLGAGELGVQRAPSVSVAFDTVVRCQNP